MKIFYHTLAVSTLWLCKVASTVAYRLSVVCIWATLHDIEIDLERQRKRWS